MRLLLLAIRGPVALARMLVLEGIIAERWLYFAGLGIVVLAVRSTALILCNQATSGKE
jgi:hypothetical protein